MRQLFVFVLLATVVACSSSSSSPETSTERTDPTSTLGASEKVRTCKNQKLNPPRTSDADACDACVATSCKDEGARALGTDPKAFGGLCKETLDCLCACDATDTLCLAVCPSPSAECKEALDAAQTCEHTTCASACGAK